MSEHHCDDPECHAEHQTTTIRVSIDRDIEGRGWWLCLSDADKFPHGITNLQDAEASVGLNKRIAEYLRDKLAEIEDELPE